MALALSSARAVFISGGRADERERARGGDISVRLFFFRCRARLLFEALTRARAHFNKGENLQRRQKLLVSVHFERKRERERERRGARLRRTNSETRTRAVMSLRTRWLASIRKRGRES